MSLTFVTAMCGHASSATIPSVATSQDSFALGLVGAFSFSDAAQIAVEAATIHLVVVVRVTMSFCMEICLLLRYFEMI